MITESRTSCRKVWEIQDTSVTALCDAIADGRLYLDGSQDPDNSGPAISDVTIRNVTFQNLGTSTGNGLPVRLFGITGITRVQNCKTVNTRDLATAWCSETIFTGNHTLNLGQRHLDIPGH